MEALPNLLPGSLKGETYSPFSLTSPVLFNKFSRGIEYLLNISTLKRCNFIIFHIEKVKVISYPLSTPLRPSLDPISIIVNPEKGFMLIGSLTGTMKLCNPWQVPSGV